MNREHRQRVMENAAWRRIGHEHAYMIAFGPYFWRIAVLVAAVGALMWMWVSVPHFYLGVTAFALATALAVGWLAYSNSQAALSRRMSARAGTAGGPRGVGLGWAVGAVVALLGTTGWVSLWSPWA
jgi:hypothetical protein